MAMAAGSRLICLNNVPMEIELTKAGSADLALQSQCAALFRSLCELAVLCSPCLSGTS